MSASSIFSRGVEFGLVRLVYCLSEILTLMDERKPGTVESYFFEPLKQFGVSASVWDEVLDEDLP
jgi:hypothetical protein